MLHTWSVTGTVKFSTWPFSFHSLLSCMLGTCTLTATGPQRQGKDSDTKTDETTYPCSTKQVSCVYLQLPQLETKPYITTMCTKRTFLFCISLNESDGHTKSQSSLLNHESDVVALVNYKCNVTPFPHFIDPTNLVSTKELLLRNQVILSLHLLTDRLILMRWGWVDRWCWSSTWWLWHRWSRNKCQRKGKK